MAYEGFDCTYTPTKITSELLSARDRVVWLCSGLSWINLEGSEAGCLRRLQCLLHPARVSERTLSNV